MAESYSNSSASSSVIINSCYAMAYVEFLLFIPTIPIVIFCSMIIYQTSILHRNLKGILLAQLLAILLNILPRMFALVDSLFVIQNIFAFPPKLITSAATAALTFSNMAGHVLIVERICATIYVKSYETYRSWTFTVAWVLITVTLCLAATIYQAVVTNTYFVISYILIGVYIGSMIASLVEIFIFSMITNFNKKLFSLRSFGDDETQRLSVRYQLNENIRTGRQLAPNFVCHSIAVFLSFIVAINFQFGILTNLEQIGFLYQILFLAHAFNYLALPFAMLFCHPLLNRKAMASLGMFKKLATKSTVSPLESAQPLDTHGRPFSERIRQENLDKDAYFKQLASAWGHVA